MFREKSSLKQVFHRVASGATVVTAFASIAGLVQAKLSVIVALFAVLAAYLAQKYFADRKVADQGEFLFMSVSDADAHAELLDVCVLVGSVCLAVAALAANFRPD